ncbi:osmoprotectant transport system permease protein [Agrobacterium larrymoorei]|uniref:Osmoprotectant transport system permease protein n=1 Tax=Agrobacterium larrymoorei TaxID=160699 RepID=A0AAJ2BJ72_9HYPH|nr:ABC transporter permease [Agrobacterium larrymoorei]MDR6103789.1 osmoprotectant transport system permease protein [Agrobacterium larrymoorei]
MQSGNVISKPQSVTRHVDKVGVLICGLLLYAALVPTFVSFRANRIVQGEGRFLLDSMPPPVGYGLIGIILLAAAVALFAANTKVRLATAFAALIALAVAVGLSASSLIPPENTYARVSAASGFWLLLAGLVVLATDAIARLRPKPLTRLILLALSLLLLSAVLLSGLWKDLSVIKEYQSRADIFWTEAQRHLQLALGSVIAAMLAGIPLGVLCFKVERIRAAMLNSLNIIQTIPSIALFGLLIAPLGWIGTHVPGASDIGIRGIGAAPAFVALFLYSLLPIVSNTAVGLAGVSPAVRDAARGIGMTGRQSLLKIEFPLALPIILTGIRIVLVQNIGLATIAALIGGGGFGVFVFQGIGQTAMDLVLLGTIPTVILGFAAAILLDALIDSKLLSRGKAA